MLILTISFLSLGCGERQTVSTTPPEDLSREIPTVTDPPPRLDTAAPEPPPPAPGTLPNLLLDEPPPGATLRQNPIPIRGRARTFENNVVIHLLDANGRKIREIVSTAVGELGEHNPFTAEAWLTRDPGATVRIELIEHSMKDGSLLTRTAREYPVDIAMREVTLHFSSGDGTDCRQVTPVQRTVPASQSLIRLLVEALIDGPTADEARRGVSGQFPSGSGVNAVNLRNGLAIVDFNQRLVSVGGSCRAAAIQAMVESTLLALPEVKRVEIRADGSREQALQP